MAKRFYLIVFFLIIWILSAVSQPITENTEVSLITCGSGNDLYSTFGHSALHISDRSTGLDRIYNYGTFDFNTDNFYLKFARGKLNYSLNVTAFNRFVRAYQLEGRWVKRQVLDLTGAEKAEIYDFWKTMLCLKTGIINMISSMTIAARAFAMHWKKYWAISCTTRKVRRQHADIQEFNRPLFNNPSLE